MLYQNIIKSDEGRLIRKIVETQIERDRRGTWYDGVKRIMEECGVEDEAKGMKKSEWKSS